MGRYLITDTLVYNVLELVILFSCAACLLVTSNYSAIVLLYSFSTMLLYTCDVVVFFVLYELVSLVLLFLALDFTMSYRSLYGLLYNQLISGATSVGLIFSIAGHHSALTTILLLVKLASYPLSIWLLEVHSSVPTVVSILLSCVLIKFGLIGLMRFFNCTSIVVLYSALAIALCLVMFYESDFKRIVALSSAIHATELGLMLTASASLYLYTLLHTISSSLMFVVCEYSFYNLGTKYSVHASIGYLLLLACNHPMVKSYGSELCLLFGINLMVIIIVVALSLIKSVIMAYLYIRSSNTYPFYNNMLVIATLSPMH